MFNQKLAKLFAIICFSSVVAACSQSNADQANKEKEKPVYKIPVETQPVRVSDISSFYATTASLDAPLEATLVSRLAGMVETLHIEEGDRVTKGQLLATVDAKRLRFDLERAQAEVMVIEQELNRLKKMDNQEYISRDQLAKLEFNLAAAKSLEKLAELKVFESEIRAPFDGVITDRFVKVGAMATEFSKLFHIINEDELHAIIHMPEAQLKHINVGQSVFVQTSLQNDTDYIKGNVLRISPRIERQSGTFKVTVQVNNRDHLLKAGMFAKVKVKYATHNDALTIPANALVNQDNRYSVFTIDGEKARKVPVTLGFRDNGLVEVIDGLTAADAIVVRGQQSLKDDALVEVIAPLNVLAAK
ncbi:efflux RND transporter periplasmic adaptor subunit [Paraferrimonas sp. SM1919]|uniref:efflux RND transporter periplasmic adaptor subunit n=1 Tax=Paraferrimonas sp. SM1919 TaxID=2662263 RepID=UPI0013D32099|nr:efflux RND transporter periplasmic adaptor subunit [Paraferrimonas sp. SM1919]